MAERNPIPPEYQELLVAFTRHQLEEQAKGLTLIFGSAARAAELMGEALLYLVVNTAGPEEAVAFLHRLIEHVDDQHPEDRGPA
jgi:hypothetical protein